MMFHVEPVHLLSEDLKIERRFRSYEWYTTIGELLEMYEDGRLVMPDGTLPFITQDEDRLIRCMVGGSPIPDGWFSLRRKEGKWMLEKGKEKFMFIIYYNIRGCSDALYHFKKNKFHVNKTEEEWIAGVKE